jgi:hypothetical protein
MVSVDERIRAMAYVIQLNNGQFLGRMNLTSALRPVPFAFAYTYETATDAAQVAQAHGVTATIVDMKTIKAGHRG